MGRFVQARMFFLKYGKRKIRNLLRLYDTVHVPRDTRNLPPGNG